MRKLANKDKDFDVNDITDEDFPFQYILGRVRNDIIVDGDPALEVMIFNIEKEGDMINASCDQPKLFLSAEKWEILKNKLDMQFAMGEDDE